jgi:hypothetical protein
MPGDGPFILSGGGVVLGNTLYLNLSTSQRHASENYRDTGIMHLELDKATLDGQFYEAGAADFDVVTLDFSGHFAAGTFKRTGQPIMLAPAATINQKPLLLDK